MKGSLEILEVLMCLDIRQSITSSIIRERLKKRNLNTLNSRLERLSRQNIIEKINKKEIGDKIKPGGDKIKYKLTKEGLKLKEYLLKQAEGILLLDEKIQKELLKRIITKELNIIPEILNEYSKELDAHTSGKELSALKKKLKLILNKYLS